MIRLSFITTSILLITYSLFIHFVEVPWSTAQQQWQENIIKAQKYIYDNKKYDVVLVGSSMANNLKVDQIPGWYNLACASEGPSDGLNIILKSGNIPKTILIEMNKLEKPLDTDLDQRLFGPVDFFLSKYFPIFRKTYQPAGLLNFIDLIKRPYKPANQKILSKSLPRIKSQYENDFLADFEVSLKNLQKELSLLKQQGVKVVFFEMPMHPEICNSPKEEKLRSTIKEFFPEPVYSYIPSPDCFFYETQDAIHLMPQSAILYLNELQSWLNQNP